MMAIISSQHVCHYVCIPEGKATRSSIIESYSKGFLRIALQFRSLERIVRQTSDISLLRKERLVLDILDRLQTKSRRDRY